MYAFRPLIIYLLQYNVDITDLYYAASYNLQSLSGMREKENHTLSRMIGLFIKVDEMEHLTLAEGYIVYLNFNKGNSFI